jgi:RNA polymerase sigma-70 factor, ECF subfamily
VAGGTFSGRSADVLQGGLDAAVDERGVQCVATPAVTVRGESTVGSARRPDQDGPQRTAWPRDPSDLLRDARAGDPGAWAELYERHAGRLVLFLRWLPTAEPGLDVEAIAARAWLMAASELATSRAADRDFEGWLFGLARRQAVGHRGSGIGARRPRVDVDVDAASVTSRGGDEGSSPVRRLEALPIRRALAEMDPRQAEVVVCRDVVGLDTRSTAMALGRTRISVRVLRRRALGRLSALLGG